MTGRNIKKGSFKKGEEDAVSPVIGVILMVAITVILAAVIGAFVFGMGSGISKSYIVAATASQMGNDIIVTYNGGPDADQVAVITVTAAGEAGVGTAVPVPHELVNTSDSTNLGTVGASETFLGGTSASGGTSGKNDHVVVTAKFSDESIQVILDTYV
jgi:flagellin-like protein